MCNKKRGSDQVLHFFGDSWSAEFSELEWIYKIKVQEKMLAENEDDYSYASKFVKYSDYDLPNEQPKSYPRLIGEILNLEYKNYSKGASSQMYMLDSLVKSEIKENDHAIFSLTSPARRFYYTENGETQNTFADTDVNRVNDIEDNWLAAVCCFSIYSYCKQNGVIPWFISTFNVSSNQGEKPHKLWAEIPDDRWIIDKQRCVVQELFDPEHFSSTYEEFWYRNSDWVDWLNKNNEQVKKYIRPCYDHPNQHGRRIIAEKIANAISESYCIIN